MELNAAAVKELREQTGAGFMDCKKALAETGGNLEKAVDYLRQKGLAAAAKKADRVAADGAVGAYVHPGGKIGVLVEINCQTDFVARTAEFQALLKDMAMQIAAANPRYVKREDVSADEIEKEREIYRSQALESGKAEKFVEKIVEGKMERFYSEVCLLEQAFIKDPDRKVIDTINDAITRLGEKIEVRRFARYHLGEGVQKDSNAPGKLMNKGSPKYKRIILKVTGEVFAGPQKFGIDGKTVKAFAQEIQEVKEMGCELALVIGGGNIFRGAVASDIGMDRASADTMG